MQDPTTDDVVKAHDLFFKRFIHPETIAGRVQEIGSEIARRHRNQTPVFLTILNGAVFFASDLIRACPLQSELSFVRLASYEGTTSSGSLTEVLGLKEDLRGRLVIVVEDIIDTGNTMAGFLPQLEKEGPGHIEVATLLYKPESYMQDFRIDYIGFEISDRFVIGYGLDYNRLGRSLPGIYQLVD
jgi:hypoxanthine phosphoribosyltransferase